MSNIDNEHESIAIQLLKNLHSKSLHTYRAILTNLEHKRQFHLHCKQIRQASLHYNCSFTA